MIGVTAKLSIAAGKEADFEAAAKDLAAKVNANEPGCLMYELTNLRKTHQFISF